MRVDGQVGGQVKREGGWVAGLAGGWIGRVCWAGGLGGWVGRVDRLGGWVGERLGGRGSGRGGASSHCRFKTSCLVGGEQRLVRCRCKP